MLLTISSERQTGRTVSSDDDYPHADMNTEDAAQSSGSLLSMNDIRCTIHTLFINIAYLARRSGSIYLALNILAEAVIEIQSPSETI